MLQVCQLSQSNDISINNLIIRKNCKIMLSKYYSVGKIRLPNHLTVIYCLCSLKIIQCFNLSVISIDDI